MTRLNRITNLGSYSGPTLRFTISDRHLSVTLRKSGTSKNRAMRLSTTFVSKIKPSGIQFKNRSIVSSVALISEGFVAFSSTSVHNWNTSPNSPQNWFFRFRALAWVICSAEKSNTSSDKRRRMAILFSQIDKEPRDDDTISGMKFGQLCGHSCLRIWMSVVSSFPSNVRSRRRFSSSDDMLTIISTIKFRMPCC